jgi:hypothetical protein
MHMIKNLESTDWLTDWLGEGDQVLAAALQKKKAKL